MNKGNLKELMSFPAVGYTKPNGYLGILGLDRITNELYISSKSTVKGLYADMFKGLVYELGTGKVSYIKNYLKNNDVTLIFEVIKYEKDPHIIKYKEDKLVLLSIVNNTVNFSEREYNEVLDLSKILGVEVTEPDVLLNSWEEFKLFYKNCMDENVYDLENDHIEGYVIKCSNGFYVKLKMPFYNYWKKFRGLINRYKNSKDKNIFKGLNSYEIEILEIGAEMFKDKEVSIIDLLGDERIIRIVKLLNREYVT